MGTGRETDFKHASYEDCILKICSMHAAVAVRLEQRVARRRCREGLGYVSRGPTACRRSMMCEGQAYSRDAVWDASLLSV